jgi:hypothetical protein
MTRYLAPVKWLGGIALLLFVLAALFGSAASGLVSEATSSSVLFRAVPFFLAFVGVLLIFILLIVLVALRFNGKVPRRTYDGIERLAIIGILFGTVCLFNPWSVVPYRYGFGLLLVSLLSFILWTHVTPPRASIEIPPLKRMQHAVGLAVAAVVLVGLTLAAISSSTPQPPYGLRERVWNSYNDDRKQQVADAALNEFISVEVPFLFVFNLFPAALAYFVVRELAGGATVSRRELAPAASAQGGD